MTKLILHHYPLSPYSEKIRLMLGYAEVPWRGVISPEMPPRPTLDPLLGGYRKMPVAQDGADLFCDTHLISAEIAERAQLPALDPANCDEAGLGLSAGLETDVFWACVASIPAHRVLKQLVFKLGIRNAYRFIRDRAGVARDAEQKPMAPKQAVALFRQHLEELNAVLDVGGPYLGGEAPCHLDFAAYHTFWFQRVVGELPIPKGIPAMVAWFHLMGELGHGTHHETHAEEAFKAVAACSPRPVSAEQAGCPGVGETVSIGPDDYALDTTEGTLVGGDDVRWIIARESGHGPVHVHFPRQGFRINR
jgi:glutathione S-transferase